MKTCRLTLLVALGLCLLAGCATTDNEVSPKDRERMAREMEKADRQQAREQTKAMRESGQRRTTR